MNFTGIITGAATFLLIGLFHPIVIKAEYYWGVKSWWIFLILGVLGLTGSIFIEDNTISTVVGVFGITCIWTIKEIFEQVERVEKGWFPRNPKRKYDK